MGDYLDPEGGVGRRIGPQDRGLGGRALLVLFAVCALLLALGVTGALNAEDYPYQGECRVLPETPTGYTHPIVGARASCPDTPSPGGPGVGE